MRVEKKKEGSGKVELITRKARWKSSSFPLSLAVPRVFVHDVRLHCVVVLQFSCLLAKHAIPRLMTRVSWQGEIYYLVFISGVACMIYEYFWNLPDDTHCFVVMFLQPNL